MDNDDAQVREVLSKVWGPHYRFVGEDYVNQIQDAAQTAKPVEEIVTAARGGDDFDWVESVKILYEAIKVINVVLTLYFGAKRLLTKEELSNKVRESGVVNDTTNPAVASKVEMVVESVTSSDK